MEVVVAGGDHGVMASEDSRTTDMTKPPAGGYGVATSEYRGYFDYAIGGFGGL